MSYLRGLYFTAFLLSLWSNKTTGLTFNSTYIHTNKMSKLECNSGSKLIENFTNCAQSLD